MKFFVDTAESSEIQALAATGLLDGVTTNPSLIKKSGRDFKEVVKEICGIVPGKPVSAEVTALDAPTMLEQAKKLAEIADNVVIKLPLTMDGLTACRHLTDQGVKTNVTLCFSAAQAILAAKAGATYVSPFVGRHDDVGHDGMHLIQDICSIYSQYSDFTTEVLVASIRHPVHVVTAGLMGADVCTIPPKIIHQLVKHPLTESGLDAFMKDWAETGQDV